MGSIEVGAGRRWWWRCCGRLVFGVGDGCGSKGTGSLEEASGKAEGMTKEERGGHFSNFVLSRCG